MDSLRDRAPTSALDPSVFDLTDFYRQLEARQERDRDTEKVQRVDLESN